MRQVLILSLVLVSLCCGAQTGKVAYTREYDFKQGVFLTIEDFKANNPILKSDILSPIPNSEIDFMSQVMEQNYVRYKDSGGAEQKLMTSSVWGFSQNRTIFINYNGEFHRMSLIGNLCLFSAMVVQTPLRDEALGDMYAIEPRFQELQQFVLDTKSNKMLDFTSKNMEVLLKDDEELYSAFMKLKRRKKADSIFVYLRNYNEKHPLYLASK